MKKSIIGELSDAVNEAIDALEAGREPKPLYQVCGECLGGRDEYYQTFRCPMCHGERQYRYGDHGEVIRPSQDAQEKLSDNEKLS